MAQCKPWPAGLPGEALRAWTDLCLCLWSWGLGTYRRHHGCCLWVVVQNPDPLSWNPEPESLHYCKAGLVGHTETPCNPHRYTAFPACLPSVPQDTARSRELELSTSWECLWVCRDCALLPLSHSHHCAVATTIHSHCRPTATTIPQQHTLALLSHVPWQCRVRQNRVPLFL